MLREDFITSAQDLDTFHHQLYGNRKRYFSKEELDCPHCGELRLSKALYCILHELREFMNRPIIITSGYRCKTYNQRIGGVPNSAHTLGYAVDIKATTSNFRYDLLSFLLCHKFTLEDGSILRIERIGISDDFLHIDIDASKPYPVVWTYGSKRHIA